MTEPPENADHGRVADASLAADNRGDGEHVVGIGSVAHTEKKSEDDDGE